VVISTLLLNILLNKGYGCEIRDPISGKRYKFVGYAFVDDTNLAQCSPGEHDVKKKNRTCRSPLILGKLP